MSRLAGLLAALVLALAGAASAARTLAPGDDGRLSLLSDAPSAPETPDLATPEAVLAAYRAGAISAPAPMAGYFTAHWFVAEIPDAGAPLAVAIWQALIAQADLWVFEGDRLLDHRRVGVSVAQARAAPAFAAGFALPVAPAEKGGRTLVLRVEPLMFLGTDVELATDTRVRRVMALRGMLFPAVLGLFLGVAILHSVLWLRFGEWRNGLFAGVLAITFFDWFQWLGGPQALGVVTSRDIGFAIVAGSTYAHTLSLSLLYACIFAAPRRRRRMAIAALGLVFAAYVVYPLFPEADAGKHVVATLMLMLAQIAVIAAMAGPALAARAPGTRCALMGSVVKVLQSAMAFAPMAIPGMETVNIALTAAIGHFDSGAIVIALVAFAMMSLSLWDRHRAAIRARETAAREARLEAVRVAQICHDIRSPLHAVQSLLTALDLDEAARDRRPDIAEARGVLGSIRDLVEDIVTAARGGDRPERRDAPVALEAMARRVAAAVRETCEQRGASVRVRMAPTAPATIRSDPVALERILGNLAANAARACRRGPFEIAVEPGPADAAARLLVLDDGPGMPAAARARLLGEPSAKGGATGAMGLTVVRTLAQALGARLAVEYPNGGGTLVTVDLPAASREPSVEPALAGLRLLVVEDDPVTTSAMVSILRAEGHCVATADDGARGLALATTGGFDAALIDLDLGQDAGCDLIKGIRRLPDPVRAGLPVIVVSGHPDTVRMAQVCGAQGALPKPFDRAALRAALAPVDPRPSGSPPVVEPDQLDELADALSAEGFQELVESAEAHIRACAETMLRADADRTAAGRAAHRLGGAAAIVGFADLSAAARAFESAAEKGADLDAQRRVVGARIDEALTRLGALRLTSVAAEARIEEQML